MEQRRAVVKHVQMGRYCSDNGDKTILKLLPKGEAVMPRQTGKQQHTCRPLGKRLGCAKSGKAKQTAGLS